MKTIDSKVKLTLDGNVIELSIEEARQLHAVLSGMFGATVERVVEIRPPSIFPPIQTIPWTYPGTPAPDYPSWPVITCQVEGGTQ